MKRHKHDGVKGYHPIEREHRSTEAQQAHDDALMDPELSELEEKLLLRLRKKQYSEDELNSIMSAFNSRPEPTLQRYAHARDTPDSTVLRLVHPGGGSAYALSYRPQKWAESLSGGEKPNIVGMGHYHKAEQLFYRNMHMFQTGTFQAQTGFMRRKSLAAHVGAWVLFIDDNEPIGLLGDTHIGSKYFLDLALEEYYNLAVSEGVTKFYHSGDICEGENMYRGQVYGLEAHGLEAQADAVEQKFPLIDGVTTYFITGNHDLSFWKTSGADIGKAIALRRPDLVYLGQEEADIVVADKPIKNLKTLLVPFY